MTKDIRSRKEIQELFPLVLPENILTPTEVATERLIHAAYVAAGRPETSPWMLALVSVLALAGVERVSK